MSGLSQERRETIRFYAANWRNSRQGGLRWVGELLEALEAAEERERVAEQWGAVKALQEAADAIDALHPEEAPKNSAIFLRSRAALTEGTQPQGEQR